MSSEEHHSSLATLGGLTACLIWGAAIAVLGVLAPSIGALSACGYECLIAGGILLLRAIFQGTLRPMLAHPPSYYIFCGGFWMANFVLIWIAAGLVRQPEQLVIVGLFNYLWPVFTLLGSIILLKKKVGIMIVPGIVVTLGGLILSKAVLFNMPLGEALGKLFELFDDNLPAYLCAAFDALAWALYSNLTRRLSDEKLPGAVPLFMLLTAVLLIAAGRWKGEISIWSPEIVITLALWSSASALAYVAWDFGMRKGNMVLVSTASMLIPLLSTVITCFVNHIPLTGGLLFASACIVAGAALCRRGIYD